MKKLMRKMDVERHIKKIEVSHEYTKEKVTKSEYRDMYGRVFAVG
jgi:hypothetical protein